MTWIKKAETKLNVSAYFTNLAIADWFEIDLESSFLKPSHPCLVDGAQQREFPKEILQAKQAGDTTK